MSNFELKNSILCDALSTHHVHSEVVTCLFDCDLLIYGGGLSRGWTSSNMSNAVPMIQMDLDIHTQIHGRPIELTACPTPILSPYTPLIRPPYHMRLMEMTKKSQLFPNLHQPFDLSSSNCACDKEIQHPQNAHINPSTYLGTFPYHQLVVIELQPTSRSASSSPKLDVVYIQCWDGL
jgi:hypothetical protein